MPRPGSPGHQDLEPSDLSGRQLAPLARLEVLDGETGVFAAMQAADGMTDRLAHPPDLTLSPLVEDELEPRGTESPHRGRRGRTVIQLDALGEPPERLSGRTPFHLCLVHLVHLVARVSEPVR